MKVTLQFFASVRERLGREHQELDVPEGIRVAELRALLAQRHPELAPLLPRVAVAINREYSRDDDPVPEGATVALIPPIAGGAPRLHNHPLDLGEVIREVTWPGAGAVTTFCGTVRNESRGRDVNVLEYEAYPEMAEDKLAAVEDEVRRRWPQVRCALRHRIGRLEVGDLAVVIAVAAPHRKEAFAACSFAIDHLKATVPLWKKESGPDGAAWVEECVPGAAGEGEPPG